MRISYSPVARSMLNDPSTVVARDRTIGHSPRPGMMPRARTCSSSAIARMSTATGSPLPPTELLEQRGRFVGPLSREVGDLDDPFFADRDHCIPLFIDDDAVR